MVASIFALLAIGGHFAVSESIEEMRSFLGASGILAAVRANETCFVVVPSFRLRAGRFALLLPQNGVSCRALGHGTGRVRDAVGHEEKVRGILVLAVHNRDLRKTTLLAKLCGVIAVPLANQQWPGRLSS